MTFTRNQLLAWLFVALVPAFVLTDAITRRYRAHERELAREWQTRGEERLARGAHDEAVLAFQTALRFAPENRTYTFSLARALLASGQTGEAGAYLRSLWEAEPGNGPVNLALGRAAARERNTRDAIRFYHLALDGSWPDTPDVHRRTTRLELSRYLISVDEAAAAQAELIPLADDVGGDAELALEVSRLLTASGSRSRAREVLERALERSSGHADLLAEAGVTALSLSDYASALTYFRRAADAGAEGPRVRDGLELSRAVLENDPFARRLSSAERARRVLRLFERAATRAESCGLTGDLPAQARALRGSAAPRRLRADPELRERLLELAGRLEEAVESCDPELALDRAIVILARNERTP